MSCSYRVWIRTLFTSFKPVDIPWTFQQLSLMWHGLFEVITLQNWEVLLVCWTLRRSSFCNQGISLRRRIHFCLSHYHISVRFFLLTFTKISPNEDETALPMILPWISSNSLLRPTRNWNVLPPTVCCWCLASLVVFCLQVLKRSWSCHTRFKEWKSHLILSPPFQISLTCKVCS